MTEGAELYLPPGSPSHARLERPMCRLAGSLVVGALVAGCAVRPAERVSAVYAHDSRELVRLDHDADGDGLIEARVYTRSGRPVRLEADADGDGVVERREIYGGGALVRTETDANGDGLMDRWEEFRDGALVRLMLDDERRHGRPTRRIVYGQAQTAGVETDLDGNGEWDVPRAR